MKNNLPTTTDELVDLVLQLQKQIKSLETTVAQLRLENTHLKKENTKLKLRLKKSRVDPPPIVKPNTPDTGPPTKRKQRVSAYVRERSTPDQTVIHAYSHCPHCHTPVTGSSLAYEREVIDLPQTTPVVTLHKVIKRHCMGCGRWITPRIDWSQLVMGQSRFGLGLVSLVISLRQISRLPVRAIQRLLKNLYGLWISVGEIVELSHKVAKHGEEFYQKLKDKLNHQPLVHADETSFRENGKNGYIWNFTTSQIRYYVYRLSRAKVVVDEVLNQDFEGVLTTDFYAAYNHLACQHQRCWAHLLRHIHQLVQLFSDNQELEQIKDKITKLFNQAKKIQSQTGLDLKARHKHRRRLENNLLRLIQPYLTQTDHPFRRLAKRIDYYIDELFTFVLDPKFDPTNNPAERAVRHQVIARKISGGTRSMQGTRTQERLTTLFSTWTVNNLNPIEECHKLLIQPNYATKFVQEL